MVRGRILNSALCGALLLSASAAQVHGEERHELSVQGTGFFTKVSSGNGIVQHSTDTGGFLLSYRFHFNRWRAADASYGYTRNTQQNWTPAGSFIIQSDVHQHTTLKPVSFGSKQGIPPSHTQIFR